MNSEETNSPPNRKPPPAPPPDNDLDNLPQPEGVPTALPISATVGAATVTDAGHDTTAAGGWVPLHRHFQSEWWWERQPWSYAHIFMDLIARANVRPRKAEFAGKVVEIGRGQMATSVTALALRAGVDRKSVRRFLTKMGEAGELETRRGGTDGILVTITHYDTYTFTGTAKGR